ncbi:hypothetical protein [Leptospirillum ferriphilum]|uniref:hypothetical protein n=1 Tax=Leptospirillum ferriphilum TaxID=178606 RepID=UPI0006B1D74D|nr:hypothetical protein [Leptospirillum ferriphilum]
MSAGIEIFLYWSKIDRQFSRAIRQIESEEENTSVNPDARTRFALFLEEWEKNSLDPDVLLEAILSFPLGQSLYLARKIQEERLPALRKMATDPRAEPCRNRIVRTIARRLVLRTFEPSRLDFLISIIDSQSEKKSGEVLK